MCTFKRIVKIKAKFKTHNLKIKHKNQEVKPFHIKHQLKITTLSFKPFHLIKLKQNNFEIN